MPSSARLIGRRARRAASSPKASVSRLRRTLPAPLGTELNFSIDDPFYYQYRVTHTKTGFVVEARGDLDGDGQFSLFRRTGTITPDGSV